MLTCTSERNQYPFEWIRTANKNKNERDICQLAYAKSFAKTTGTNSPYGHATIKPKWRNFEKKSLNGPQQWLVVTRPSADCRTTFLDVSSDSENFWKKSLKVTRQWSEVTRPLDDCQTTFFRRFKQFGKFLKEVTEGHATVVGGHATVGWLSNNVF